MVRGESSGGKPPQFRECFSTHYFRGISIALGGQGGYLAVTTGRVPFIENLKNINKNNMLYELRYYKIAPGKIDDYINHAGKVAVPKRGHDYGRLLGF